jgi:hypothetical protein
MRWENLFDDLESQLATELATQEIHQQHDEERFRQARLTLHDRLRYLSPTRPHHRDDVTLQDPVSMTLTTGLELSVHPIRRGKDWCAVEVSAPAVYAGHALLPLRAVISLVLTPDQLVASVGTAQPEADTPPRLADNVTLGFVLRDLSRRRRTLQLHTPHGVFTGTLDRVGLDHVDIAEHAPDVPRRQDNVRRWRTLALGQLVLVRIL